MRFIDTHLHTQWTKDLILERLSMAVMESAVIPSPLMLISVISRQKYEALMRRLSTICER